jgi:hypothetical protein
MSANARRRRPTSKRKAHWCELCHGRPHVYGPDIQVDVGGGKIKTFPRVIPCPNKAKAPDPKLDRKRQAAGETEVG